MPDWLALFALLFGLIALSVPIPIAIGITTLVGLQLVDLPLIALAQNTYNALNNVPLMAIPLFVLAGALMERGGLADRLVAFAESLVGSITGSFGVVTILGCMFFAAISGSGPATAAAVGAVTVPAMIRQGFPRALAGAVAAAGGALGSLIPPSNLFVIFGIVTGTSIPKLFLAGVVPGFVAGLLLVAIVWLIACLRGYSGTGRRAAFSARQAARSAWASIWALLAPVLVLGGIYVGIFTPTEAAAVAVVYALVIGAAVYRTLTWPRFVEALRSTTVISGTVVIMLGPTIAFGQVAAMMQIPEQLEAIMGPLATEPFALLAIVALVFIVTGTFMETISQIILFTPLFFPLAINAGVDPMALGVVVVLCCEIGFLTPPVGANLFIAMRLARVSIGPISVAVLPLLMAYLMVIVLVSRFPALASWLPTLVYVGVR